MAWYSILALSIFVFSAFFIRESIEIAGVPPLTNARDDEIPTALETISSSPFPLESPPPPLTTRSTLNPSNVQGIFVTAWTFSRKDMRARLTRLTEETEINAWVIDIKGNDGVRLFEIMNDDRIQTIIDELHAKNIYLIGRVTVFQDSKFSKLHPELSLSTPDGKLWKDQGGYPWLDPASQEVWNYTLETSKKAVDLGFDEIQLDYVRFPSEGALDKVVYPFYDRATSKTSVITSWMKYFHDEMKRYAPTVTLSADIFGYTLLRENDNGIGQRLLDLLPYFDFISPMVYPSHYAAGNFGFLVPAEHPYEVITRSIEEGIKILEKQLIASTANTSVTPSDIPVASGSVIPEPSAPAPATYPCSLLGLGEGSCKPSNLTKKLRPWLQDFSLATRYDATRVKAQITASHDLGITTWMLWNPNNVYTRDALESQN